MDPGVKRGRGRPRDEARAAQRREEILEAAAGVFARDGYRQTDLQVVADTVGVGKGTIYRHFPSKQDLFLAAADRGMDQLHERVHAARDSVGDPLAQIAEAIRAYLAFFQEHPEHVELLIQERAEFRDRKTPTYFEHREKEKASWLEMGRELVETGRFRSIPIERVMNVMSDLVYGTMFTNYFANRDESYATQAEDILDFAFGGILSDAERARFLRGKAGGSP